MVRHGKTDQQHSYLVQPSPAQQMASRMYLHVCPAQTSREMRNHGCSVMKFWNVLLDSSKYLTRGCGQGQAEHAPVGGVPHLCILPRGQR